MPDFTTALDNFVNAQAAFVEKATAYHKANENYEKDMKLFHEADDELRNHPDDLDAQDAYGRAKSAFDAAIADERDTKTALAEAFQQYLEALGQFSSAAINP